MSTALNNELNKYTKQPRVSFISELHPSRKVCSECNGLGVILKWKYYSGPYDDSPGGIIHHDKNRGGWFKSELVSMPCPKCNGSRTVKDLENQCGLFGDDFNKRLNDFIALPGNEKAKEIVSKIINDKPKSRGLFSVYGGYGTGKSLLAKVIVNEFRLREEGSMYSSIPDLLGELRESYSVKGECEFEKILARYKNVDVLAIDEIDKVNTTPWAIETLFRIVDMRYESRAEKLTIFTMNTRPDNLPEALGYLASRLQEGIIIKMAGPDVRPAKGLQAMMDIGCG